MIKYFLIALIILFTGCAEKQVTPEIKYIKQKCPAPRPKPKFIKYNVVIMKINGEEWYALTKRDATKLMINWLSYKNWAEANAALLSNKNKSKHSKSLKK